MRAPSTEATHSRSFALSAGRAAGSGRPTAAFIDLAALSHNFQEVLLRWKAEKYSPLSKRRHMATAPLRFHAVC